MDIDPDEWQRHRRYLLATAYRLLGSVAEAEDAVQEAYVRLRRDDVTGVVDVRAWLTTVVARICLDQLRSARVQRESYVGPWLPEPLVGAGAQPDPADRVALVESVRMAMLVVLESLTPAERTAFVLHDVFEVPFEQVADVVGRTEAASRQLASRARAHVRRRVPRLDVTAQERDQAVSAFLAAAEQGDLATLVRALDPEVVFRSDGGGVVAAARHEVRGADKVARLLLGLVTRYADATVRMAPVNGGPGVVMERDGAVIAAAAVTVGGGGIAAVDAVVNPYKLRHVQPAG